MITEDKVTELFCIADDFCKEFNAEIKKNAVLPSKDGKKRRNRAAKMSDAEIITIVTGIKSNMKNKLMPIYDKIMLRKRSVIESVNDMLKNVAQLVHSRHRSVHNFIMNLLAALGAYCFFDNKPEVNFDFEIEEGNGQLVLFQ